MPILATVPVLLVRAAEINAAKKERELKEDYFPHDEPEKDEKKKSGDEYLGGR